MCPPSRKAKKIFERAPYVFRWCAIRVVPQSAGNAGAEFKAGKQRVTGLDDREN